MAGRLFFELDVTSNVETVDFEGIPAHLRPPPALIANVASQYSRDAPPPLAIEC